MKNAQAHSALSSLKRTKKVSGHIEPLESRMLLTGVVFGTPQSLSTASAGISPVYTDLADLNGDGFADLITANSNNTVSILFGKGDGTFTTPAQTFPLSFTPLTIVDGKLDPSGKTDFVVGSTTSDAVAVILQNSDGSFSKQELAATGLTNTQSVTIGNFGNGRQDIAVASFDSGASNNVAIFMNNGDGTFSSPQILSVPHTEVASITAFATSGGVDLAVADAHDNAVTVLLNNGTGTFSTGPDYQLAAGSTPETIKAGKFDLNNNTNDDLVTANGTGGSVSVLIGNGDGTFQSAPITTPIPGIANGSGLLKVRVANLDADNNPDLLGLFTAGSSADAVVLLGNGDGTFRVGNTISLGLGTETSIAAGDLNGDGLTDLVLANANQVTAILNTTNLDTTPPTGAVDITQPAVTAGSATIQFTVTYTDTQQVDATTLGNGNVTVTDPAGNLEAVTLVSTGLTSAASLTVTYQVAAPSGSLSSADDGAYLVSATSTTSQAVKNAMGVAVTAGSIGQFSVEVPAQGTPNGPNLVCTIAAKLPTSVVAGVTHSTGGETVTIVNSGNQVAKGSIVINVYASPDGTIRGNAPLVGSITRKINIRAGGRAAFVVPGFVWPASLSGTYFLVADVNATGSLAETSLTDNTNISAKSTVVVPPFVDIDNMWNMKLPKTLKVGRRVLVPVLLKNVGNVVARNTATVTLLATTNGSASGATAVGTPSVRVVIPAGLRSTVNVPVTLPTLAAGSYQLIITVSYPGDANAGNDTVTSTQSFTV